MTVTGPSTSSSRPLSAAILAAGLVLSGLFIGTGFYKGRKADRYVSVKGFAERMVQADRIAWNLSYRSDGQQLDPAIRAALADEKKVREFLKKNGVKDEEISAQPPRVESSYGTNGVSSYTVNSTFLISSSDVTKITALIGKLSELLSAGVALSGWEPPMYYFTKLNEIKPQMIAEATKDARRAAEQFAADSGSRVGGIRTASQGFFSFEGENSGMPEINQIAKKARVVISADYYLVD